MSGKPTENNHILSYFQPSSSPLPAPPSQTSTLSFRDTSPPAPSSPLSYKATPVAKKTAAALEIGASDEEEAGDEGFSDDSLEDLSALLGRERPDHTPPAKRALFSTPKANRTATGPYLSPYKPKHKFDLKALVKDARRDNAISASSVRAKASAAAAAELSSPPRGEAFDAVFTDIVKEKSGQDAHKVLRAVQRAEPIQSQPQYCFFRKDFGVLPSSPAPKLPRDSPWKLLTQGNQAARERSLISGVPQTILAKKGGLPDVLFDWILDELCIQRSSLVRREYCIIIGSCHDQVERLLTPGRLEYLFLRLGATDEIKTQDSEIAVSKLNQEPYQDRDWSCLESFLVLLSVVSDHLSTESAIYASQILLRMSMDKLLIYNIDLLAAYEEAIEKLTNAIPRSLWDSFCVDACSILHATVKNQHIRANALQCLSIRNVRTHEVRRRLAISFLLDDPGLGCQSPEQVFTLRDAIDRLNKEDFNITSQTDFAELKAIIIILDIAIDDGSPPESNSPEVVQKFNQDVDELATRLREIWRKIDDSGMKITRTETKSVVEWVQQRLSNTVRTRKKVKQSIFDVPGQKPMQQEYIAKFFKKIPKPQAESD